MARFVVLDAGPIGLLAVPGDHTPGGECRRWARRLVRSGTDVLAPDVSLYEARREIRRRRAVVQLAQLEAVLGWIGHATVTTDAWRLAEEFWAQARQAGIPTAPDDDLDGDVILAAVARTIGGPGDEVIIATTNVRHLNRFPGIDAREWREIG